MLVECLVDGDALCLCVLDFWDGDVEDAILEGSLDLFVADG